MLLCFTESHIQTLTTAVLCLAPFEKSTVRLFSAAPQPVVPASRAEPASSPGSRHKQGSPASGTTGTTSPLAELHNWKEAQIAQLAELPCLCLLPGLSCP